jgi:antitoxin PrlF
MRSTLSEKGQITVPKALREQLGIRAGDQLDLTAEDGRLMAKKTVASDPVAAAYGILDTREPTNERLRALRG